MSAPRPPQRRCRARRRAPSALRPESFLLLSGLVQLDLHFSGESRPVVEPCAVFAAMHPHPCPSRHGLGVEGRDAHNAERRQVRGHSTRICVIFRPGSAGTSSVRGPDASNDSKMGSRALRSWLGRTTPSVWISHHHRRFGYCQSLLTCAVFDPGSPGGRRDLEHANFGIRREYQESRGPAAARIRPPGRASSMSSWSPCPQAPRRLLQAGLCPRDPETGPARSRPRDHASSLWGGLPVTSNGQAGHMTSGRRTKAFRSGRVCSSARPQDR